MDIGALKLHGTFVQYNTNGVTIGSGSTAQRPAAAVGGLRYNTDNGRFEFSNATAWANIGAGDVSSVSLTGVNGAITVSGGPITTSGTFTLALAGELAGVNAISTIGFVERTGTGTYTTLTTIPVANGGTGATTAAAARTALGVPSVYRSAFTNATLSANTLTVTHNLSQQFVHVSITDNTNAVVQPDNIFMTNGTTVSVDFTSFLGSINGTWNVVVVG